MTLNQLTWCVLIVVALAPPALAWYWARAVRRHRHEALLAEQFWAFRKRLLGLFIFAGTVFGLNLSMVGWRAVIAGVVAIVTTLAIVHAVRREVLNERWSFLTFLVFRLRAAVAFGGFWMALVGAPYLVGWSGEWRRLAAPLVLFGLLVWLWWSGKIFTWLLGAEPVTSEAILEGMRHLVQKTQLPPPRLLRAGPPGGVLYNAYAMPSWAGHGVLFFSTLLERLSTAEVMAILAHELAHLEQYNATMLKRQLAIITVLAAVGTLAVPPAHALTDSLIVDVMWVALVLAGVVTMGRGSRARESDSDRRALELTGDADTLISALLAVHSIGLIPRRLDADVESRSTHPTLARRVRAIRALAGQPEAPGLADPVIVPAKAQGAYLLFEADRIRYLRNVAVHADPSSLESLAAAAGAVDEFPFPRIASVHLEPQGELAVVSLRPVEGERIRVPVPGQLTPQLQSLLDRIDDRFAPPLKAAESRRSVRAVAAAVLVIAVLAWQIALAVAALVTSVSPSRASAAALAAATAGAGLLLVVGGQVGDGSLAVLVFLGTVYCAVAVVRWRRSTPKAGAQRFEAVALGSAALLSLALLIATGVDPLRLSAAAAALPSALIAPLSCAAWLVTAHASRRWAQAGALVLLSLAGVIALMGTTWFIDRFSDDPMLTTRRGVSGGVSFDRVAAELAALATLETDEPGDLRVSPDGRSAAILEWCDDPDECLQRKVTVVTPDGRRELEAVDVQFLDAQTIVVAEQANADSALRLRKTLIDGTEAGWQVTVGGIWAEKLGLNTGARQWVVLGRRPRAPDGRPSGEHVRSSGSLDSAEMTVRAWGEYNDHDWPIEWLSGDRVEPMGIQTSYESPLVEVPLTMGTWLRLPMTEYRPRSTLFRWTGSGPVTVAESGLEIQCPPSHVGEPDVVCAAEDGSRTHFWRIDAASSALDPLGSTSGGRWLEWPPSESVWLSTDNRCSWQLIDLAARRDASLRFEHKCPVAVALNGSTVGALASTPDRAMAVKTYRVSFQR